MPQIVLIPGLMNDGWVWRHQVGALSRLGPVHIACNDGCDSLAAMAERILAATDGPLYVVGHSMGGRVALEMVAQAPDRVDRLALLDTGAHGVGDGEADGRLALVEIGRKAGMAAVADAWMPDMIGTSGHANHGLLEGIKVMVERCTVDDFTRQQQALLERHDRLPLLPDIAVPVLLITGAEDRWAGPQQHHDMAAAIPESLVAVVEDAGHMVPVEQPDALTRLLMDFLADS